MSSTDPFDSNDGWADLARELELDRDSNAGTGSPSEPISEESEAATDGDDFGDDATNASDNRQPVGHDFASNEDEDDGEDEDGDSASASGGEDGEDGEDGGTKKRRRRRRRRKKKPGTAETGGEDNAPVATTTIVEEVEEPSVDDSDDTGTTPEMTRELIRTWNVPSWEEIVTGLYRPQ